MIEEVFDCPKMALANRLVQWSIAQAPWRADLRASFHQCSDLLYVAPRGSNVKWSLTEVADLIYIFERNFAECWQVFVLVAT